MKTVVIQNQIWHEYGYQNYSKAFEERSDLVKVDVVPFTNVLQPEILGIPDLVMGSIRFINIARSRGWPTFRTFDPVDFSLVPKEFWLNSDGKKMEFSELFSYDDDSWKFVKPFTEKLCTSGIVDLNKSVLEQLQFTTSVELKDEYFWVATPRKFGEEYRFFVIGGQIITGSLYKQNGQGTYSNIVNDMEPWIGLNNIIEQSNIDHEFVGVIDIAPTTDGWKIVEMNNLNSSGVYACDYDALARALLNFI